MASNPKFSSEAGRDAEFAQWVENEIGGDRLRECMQCGLCSGTCPLGSRMDYTPRKLVTLAAQGFKREVLGSKSIWLCTSCYGCVSKCPRQINLTEVMYAFKRRAIAEGFAPKGDPMPILADEFTSMVKRNGRVSEPWLMAHVFFRNPSLAYVGMTGTAARLLRHGRLPLGSHAIDKRGELTEALGTEMKREEKKEGKEPRK